MKLNMKVTAMVAALSLCLYGCAGGGTGSGDSVDVEGVNPKLQQENATFFSSSGAKACLGGALVGAAACLASNSKNKLACALVAAFAGCAVAMTGNYLLDNLRANYKNLEDQLDATKEQVQEDVNKAKNMASTYDEILADDEKEIAQINKNIKNGSATKAQLAAKADEMDKNLKYMQANQKTLNEHLSAYKEAKNGLVQGKGGVGYNNKQDAEKKLAELESRIAMLEKEQNDLLAKEAEYTAKIAGIRSTANS